MTHLTARAAAAARAGGVRSLADRPSQRRNAAGLRGRTSPVASQLRVATTADVIELQGTASVVEHAYDMWDFFGPYTEVISDGAFARTVGSEPDVVLNVNHAGLPLARTISGTLTLAAAADLTMSARLDGSLEDVRRIASGIVRGDITEMSFAFTITSGRWSPDWTEYRIEEVDIDRGDVSVVTFGANPATSVGFAGSDPADEREAPETEETRSRVPVGTTLSDLDAVPAARRGRPSTPRHPGLTHRTTVLPRVRRLAALVALARRPWSVQAPPPPTAHQKGSTWTS